MSTPTSIHPAAPPHLPIFIPGPDGSDGLMWVTAGILLVSTLAFGLLFLRLHTLPERMAHRTHKLQFEIVAVLGLLALFTHIHAFWVAGLLLALVDIPDFLTPMRRIAGSSERIAGLPPGGGDDPQARPQAQAAKKRGH
jgi:NADH:ubiquinone oxidoreductase subunit 5 (subunit L)/multisubunit Na+/H+ antiporter MnhA subunit